MDENVRKIILDNTVLIINIVSVEIGLLIGIWFRSSFIDKTPPLKESIRNFVMFSIALTYLTCVSTFSNWPIVAIEFAALGVVSVPLSVPFYNILLNAAPNMIKRFIPDWVLKLILEPNSKTKGNE